MVWDEEKERKKVLWKFLKREDKKLANDTQTGPYTDAERERKYKDREEKKKDRQRENTKR